MGLRARNGGDRLAEPVWVAWQLVGHTCRRVLGTSKIFPQVGLPDMPPL